jgi:hypothetical protein
MKVWLDDKRPMPPEFDTHVMTSQDAIALIKTGKVTAIGLDHDLGDINVVGCGHYVSDYIEDCAYYGTIPRITWSLQTDNGPEKIRMRITMENADRYWDKHEESA